MKRKIIYLSIAAIAAMPALLQAQNVGINTDNSAPAASAMLDVKSTNKGLLIPRMTTGERITIAAPANGLMVYDITTNSFWYYKNTVWTEVTGGITFPYDGTHGNATVKALQLVNPTGDAIVGQVGGAGSGVAGVSATGNGISGTSTMGPGGLFKSTSGPAVKADGSVDILKNRLRFAGNMANGNAHGVEFSNNAGTTMSHFYGMNNDSISGFYGNNAWRLNFNNINGNLGLQSNANPRAPLSFASSAGNKIALYGDGGTDHYGIGVGNGTLQLYGPTTGADVVMGYGSSTNFTERMRVKGTGNVGIGTATPTEMLEVTGRVLSPEFTTYAGTVLNANLTLPANATIGGTVQIQGGNPAPGMVLTASNTLGNATWAAAPYGNTERFCFRSNRPANLMSATISTDYNYGTAVSVVNNNYIGINEMEITITAAGLYHFDINSTVENISFPEYEHVNVTFIVDGVEKSYFRGVRDGETDYKKSLNESFDRYIPSNTVLKFVARAGTSNFSNLRLMVTGHLIAP